MDSDEVMLGFRDPTRFRASSCTEPCELGMGTHRVAYLFHSDRFENFKADPDSSKKHQFPLSFLIPIAPKIYCAGPRIKRPKNTCSEFPAAGRTKSKVSLKC